MKYLALSALAGVLAYSIVTLFCAGVDAIGCWLYGWEPTGAGYIFGAVVFGPLAGVVTAGCTWAQLELK